MTKGLEDVAEALQPFRDMTTEHLAEWLKVAAEYRRTGVIPDAVVGKKPATRTPKAPKAPKMTTADAVAFLRDLQQRALDMEPAQVTRELEILSTMTGKELEDVQREYLGGVVAKKKADMLPALQKKIDTFRATRDRVQGILAQ